MFLCYNMYIALKQFTVDLCFNNNLHCDNNFLMWLMKTVSIVVALVLALKAFFYWPRLLSIVAQSRNVARKESLDVHQKNWVCIRKLGVPHLLSD